MLCAEDEALYNVPGAADEMPLPQATYGEARAPGHRTIDQIPLLATTGNDMSSKERVDMPNASHDSPAGRKGKPCRSSLSLTMHLSSRLDKRWTIHISFQTSTLSPIGACGTFSKLRYSIF